MRLILSTSTQVPASERSAMNRELRYAACIAGFNVPCVRFTVRDRAEVNLQFEFANSQVRTLFGTNRYLSRIVNSSPLPAMYEPKSGYTPLIPPPLSFSLSLPPPQSIAQHPDTLVTAANTAPIDCLCCTRQSAAASHRALLSNSTGGPTLSTFGCTLAS